MRNGHRGLNPDGRNLASIPTTQSASPQAGYNIRPLAAVRKACVHAKEATMKSAQRNGVQTAIRPAPARAFRRNLKTRQVTTEPAAWRTYVEAVNRYDRERSPGSLLHKEQTHSRWAGIYLGLDL